MFLEAAAAADAVQRQLDASEAREAAAWLRAIDPPLVLTCARGSSDHAATYLQYLLPSLLGVPCYSHAPSLRACSNGAFGRLGGAVMIFISQSGRSPDLLRSAEAARAAGVKLLGCINDEQSPLAGMVDLLLPLRAGCERSVAATKSFIATLSALLGLAAFWRADEAVTAAIAQLPGRLDEAWRADWSAAVEPLTTCDHLYVLGRNLTLGIAGEAALKLKETCALHAESFSLAEVAHGPMALLGPKFPVLAFPSPAAVESGALDLLGQFQDRGAQVMVAGAHLPGAVALPLGDAHATVQPILAIQSFYRVADAVARARGLNPDQPTSLSKVTKTL